MKRLLYALFVLCLVAVSILLPSGNSEASSQAHSLALTQADSGSTIYFKQNQKFTVSLPGNKTTGYNWVVVTAPGLDQQGEPEFVSDSNAIGSGGTFRYTFLATSLGTGDLKMVYRRPWEIGVAPLVSFEIRAIITDWAMLR